MDGQSLQAHNCPRNRRTPGLLHTGIGFRQSCGHFSMKVAKERRESRASIIRFPPIYLSTLKGARHQNVRSWGQSGHQNRGCRLPLVTRKGNMATFANRAASAPG